MKMTPSRDARSILNAWPRETSISFRGGLAVLAVASWVGCAPPDGISPIVGTGGSPGTGGTLPGSGGSGSGGSLGTGGAPGTGGTVPGTGGTGGAGTGGSRSGGSGSGGSSTGGAASGGSSSGGSNSGGSSAGGAAGGGRGGGTAGRAGGGTGGGAAGRAGTGGGSGGGSTGTAGAGGPSLCTPGKYLLCEGFEGAAVGNTPPTGWTRAGAASVASDQAFRGTNSMKIGAATNGARRFVYGDSESFGATHWGRIFYRVQLPVPTPFVHSTLVELQGVGASGNAAYRVVDTVKNGDTAQMHQFLYNVQPSGGEFGTGSSYNWKFDGAWHCAEWFVDANTQSYQFYFDGAEVTQIRIANANKRIELPTVFTSLSVGWNNYQAADPGFVAWIDEIAVDTARIGCGN